MEILDNSEMDSENNVQLTETMKSYLTEAAKWAKFIAIVGFVILGIFALAFLILLIGTLFLSDILSNIETKNGLQIGFLFFGIIFYAGIIFPPSWYMFRFASNILKNVPTMNVDGIEEAFRNLKSIFKFYGIFLIVVLSIYALIILGIVIKNAL